jgi:hypothetical protein
LNSDWNMKHHNLYDLVRLSYSKNKYWCIFCHSVQSIFFR